MHSSHTHHNGCTRLNLLPPATCTLFRARGSKFILRTSAALKSHIAKVKHCEVVRGLGESWANQHHPCILSLSLIPGTRWELIWSNCLVRSRGNCYCITLTDYFSKWAEAMPVPTKEASHADFLNKMIFRHWCPEEIKPEISVIRSSTGWKSLQAFGIEWRVHIIHSPID